MNVPTTEEILAAVDSVQDDAIEFLRTIVSIDSTLDKGEGRVQDAIYDHLMRVLGGGSSRATTTTTTTTVASRRRSRRGAASPPPPAASSR